MDESPFHGEDDQNPSHFIVPEVENCRLDHFLVSRVKDLSRMRLKNLIEEGCVTVNGEKVMTPSKKVHPGSHIQLRRPPLKQTLFKPQDMALDILYEDEDLLVVNKPPGMVVHPAPGHAESTLVHGLLHHCQGCLSGVGGVERPGIVHRLDKGTSGLMVVAKNDLAHQKLTQQFSDRTLSRTYTAFVWGMVVPLKGTVNAPLGRSPNHRQKQSVRRQGGKEAMTDYEVQKTYDRFASRVSCDLQTGRTHQIRVHLTHIGHGLLGDPLYGRPLKQADPKLRNYVDTHFLQKERVALHARSLRFVHPRLGEKCFFETPMPRDMLDLETFLGSIISP